MVIAIIFWVIVAVIGLLLLIFTAAIIAFLHQSYFYKITRASFVEDLEKIINGSITFPEYDSLTCVTVVQDKLLNECQYEIADMPEMYSKGAKEGFYFNEDGNKKIAEMIKMLQTTNEAVIPDKKEITRAWKGFMTILIIDAVIIAGILWVKRALSL